MHPVADGLVNVVRLRRVVWETFVSQVHGRMKDFQRKGVDEDSVLKDTVCWG